MPRTIRPDDPAIVWAGAVGVRHTTAWSQPWRLPVDRLDLFPDELLGKAGMPSGVRLRFRTNTSRLAGHIVCDDQVAEMSPLDLVVDGSVLGSTTVSADGRFAFTGLPEGDKTIEVWLPQFGVFRLASLELSDGATLRPAPVDGAPRLITYGSSITQCRGAATPTRTWPATVARQLGFELTSLGFGGQCHLDPLVARVIRDLPADFVMMCVGINIYAQGTFNRRSFLPALLGFIATVRDGHPQTPILVMSPIHSPGRETTPGGTGMALEEMRAEISRGVELARHHGDGDIHYLDGPSVLGPSQAHRLPDGVHPDDEGYQAMARVIATRIDHIRRNTT